MATDAVVVLAAGGSSRLGRPKQLIAWRGGTLLAHAARTALATELGPVIVMLGAHLEECRRALLDVPVEIVPHPQWTDGIGRTIAAAVAHVALIHPGADAILVTTCDQPHVTVDDLVAIANARRDAGRRMAAAAYAGTIGVPAVFAHSMFEELRKLQGDRGAGALLRHWRAEVVKVRCEGAAYDVDTEKDARSLADSI